MEDSYYDFCLRAYTQEYERRYEELRAAQGRNGAVRQTEVLDKEAQKAAIRVSITESLQEYPNASVADLWADIYRVHLFRKSGISDIEVIGKVISADQSWKKASGHAFEEMLKALATEALSSEAIEVVLQRDLHALLKAGGLANQPRDISWLKEQVAGNIFDLYCILRAEGRYFCFGCVQAKTSIRDRVTRDREPSIHAMQSYFWSVAFVLDGGFLAMPKFQAMVNGGSTEFPDNGWHGMYVFSATRPNGRIYPAGIDLALFAEHARKAARFWREQRQWFNALWRADGVEQV